MMETLSGSIASFLLGFVVTQVILVLVIVLVKTAPSWKRSTRKTRTVQEIFDAVIDSGCYSETRRFMCTALRVAREYKVITPKEHELAANEIKTYLGDIPCLVLVVGDYMTPVNFSATKAVYRNWNNRPVIRQNSKNTSSILLTIPNSQEHPYAEKPTI